MSDAAIPRSACVGFLEQAAFDRNGLLLTGWAVRKDTARGPSRLRIEWEDVAVDSTANIARPDVARSLGLPEGVYGFSQHIPLPSMLSDSWAMPRVTAYWEEQPEVLVQALPLLKGVLEGHLKCLSFQTFKEFETHYQNPAFRVPNPRLQAYGAARALKQAGTDHCYWLAAATLALYRCFEDNAFEVEAAEDILRQWQALAPEIAPTAKGLTLRWATSMHLACGYALLAWGRFEEAEKEFGAIAGYADRIESWPQSTTNMAMGMFIAAWLASRRGDTEAAKQSLLPTERMFQTSVGVLKIWNWHMFEELKNAVRVTQMCFGLLRRLEGEPAPHVVPPKIVLSLKDVSLVMQRLIDRGLVADEALP